MFPSFTQKTKANVICSEPIFIFYGNTKEAQNVYLTTPLLKNPSYHKSLLIDL